MRIFLLLATLFFLILQGCTKTIKADVEQKRSASRTFLTDFLVFSIKQGEHFASNNFYKPIDISELKFIVRFDSSAIYRTKAEENQYDINKLYGFSDNNSHHHQYSARFGWGWVDNALRLYGYVYNEGKLSKKEIGTVAINKEITCRISINGDNYIFSINDVPISMPRNSKGSLARGYMLYPYFGGDETAPHDIKIWIKNL